MQGLRIGESTDLVRRCDAGRDAQLISGDPCLGSRVDMGAHEHGHSHHFLPGMGHPALTPFYDSFARLVARESTFKRRLVERLGLRAGQRVLDLGSGTGTLAILIAEAQPGVTDLPFADGSFDRVTSTLMAHHLPTSAKEQMSRTTSRADCRR